MEPVSQHESLRTITYRLQTSAYANRWGTSTAQTKLNIDNGRWHITTPQHVEMLSRPGGNVNMWPTADSIFNPKIKQRSKSLQQLSSVDTDRDCITDIPQLIAVSSSDKGHQNKSQRNPQKQVHSNQPSFLSSSSSVVVNPTSKSRSKPSRLSMDQAPVSTTNKHRRRRFSLEDDPTKVAMKISLPCTGGCCYCVFSALLGPVKVYITRADKPKKEPLLLRIKDGNGKPIIPVSRKSDVRGLVYDPVSFTLHPPVKGQGPVLQKCQKQRKV